MLKEILQIEKVTHDGNLEHKERKSATGSKHRVKYERLFPSLLISFKLKDSLRICKSKNIET